MGASIEDEALLVARSAGKQVFCSRKASKFSSGGSIVAIDASHTACVVVVGYSRDIFRGVVGYVLERCTNWAPMRAVTKRKRRTLLWKSILKEDFRRF